MRKDNMVWDSNILVTIDGDEYSVDYCAVGYYYYSPGTMYRRNGDPGDPPEEDIEVSSVDIQMVYDEENNEVAYNEELWNKIEDAIIVAIETGDECGGEYLCDEDRYDLPPEE